MKRSHLRRRERQRTRHVRRLRPRRIGERRALELAARRIARNHVEMDMRVDHHQREVVDLLVVERRMQRAFDVGRRCRNLGLSGCRNGAERARVLLAGEYEASQRRLRRPQQHDPAPVLVQERSPDSRTSRWWRSWRNSSALRRILSSLSKAVQSPSTYAAHRPLHGSRAAGPGRCERMAVFACWVLALTGGFRAASPARRTGASAARGILPVAGDCQARAVAERPPSRGNRRHVRDRPSSRSS